MSDAFERFKSYLEEMSYYRLASSRIYWDMETFHTPKNAVKKHAKASSFLSMKIFEMSTSEEYGKILEEVSAPEVYDTLDDGWKITVDRRKKQYEDFKKIPADFYKKTVQDSSMAGQIWAQAKRENDFSKFAPVLKNVIENTVKTIEYTNPGEDTYEVLLSQNEEGLTSEMIDRLFGELKEGLKELLPKIFAKPEPDSSVFNKKYDINHEKAASEYLLKYMGYDFESGDLAEAEHPVTMGTGRTDVRVTDHYYENDAIAPMFSIIHEGGHGICGQNLGEEYAGTDCEGSRHKGLGESQSRFYENMLARNINFWKPIFSDIQELIPELKDNTVEQLYREANHVKVGPIRIRADEVTYCMHIILRYELEKELFKSDVDVDKLPDMWNDKMEEYLGIRPETDAEGILQDMHWSASYLGYFPSYLLGSIYDAMFLEALEEELGSVDELLANGEIKKITHWLNEKIHRYGSLYTSPEVIRRVCGKEISAQPLLRYFNKKYTEIYDL